MALNTRVDTNIDGNLISNINMDLINKRKSNILIVISIFYITFGVFIMGLVVTQSIIKDLNI